MIVLITGVPGSGKSLKAVEMMLRELKAGRRLVINGIKNLALDHELVDDDWVRDWHNRCELNDFIVIDEVQRIWPPVTAGAKPTKDIEELHVHRHKGVDFIVITQHPNRMNKTIRDLVGRHIHVRRLMGGRRAIVYEWDCAHNPNAGFRDAIKSYWPYPKKLFQYYTSAELHTKPKVAVPKTLLVIPVAIAVAVVFGWRAFRQVHGGIGPLAGAGAGAKAATVNHASATSAAHATSPVSERWRVAGRYAIDGEGYVVLADKNGRFRRELSGSFVGDRLGLTGVIDGERVAGWTGGFAADDSASRGDK